ncbi:hypothetical protein [Roseivirga seohaensis]|uniref:hypothetical protein n=1 Tax=Roseivirga seohaensis TaxID=1914963 RepID=UPI003BAA29BF
MKKLSIVIFALLAFNCSNQKVDTKKALQDMKSQEIQVVSDVQIIEKAKEIGDSISAKLKVNLEEEKVVWTAVESEDIEVKGFAFNKENSLEGKGKAIYEAYQYNSKNDIKSPANVQFMEDTQFVLYSSAMVAEGKEVGMWYIKIPRKTIVLSVSQ